MDINELIEFYLTWSHVSKIIPSNRLEIQRGELLTQKLLNLSKEIDKKLNKIENNENSTKTN